MSSERLIEVVRSSTFRRALLASLLVWLVCGSALVVVERLAVGLGTRPLMERVGWELEETLDEIRAGDHGSEESVFDEPLKLEIKTGVEEEEFVEEYISAVRRSLARSDLREGIRLALLARLALLGERELQGLEGQPLDTHAEAMLDEVPGRFHDVLEEEIEEHRHRWAGPWEESEGVIAADFGPRFREEELDDEESCIELRSPAGETLETNLGPSSSPVSLGDGFFYFRTETPEHLLEEWDEQERWCLVQERGLDDGSTLRYGRTFREFRYLRQAALLRNGALMVGLLIAVGSSYLLAERAVGLLFDLSRAGERIKEGDFSARIRRPGDQGDFDRAVGEINTMLDQLEHAVSSLSQVTDNIAHDLRTPLTRLQGQLDLLKRHPEPVDDMIEAVQDEANQLLATFNALLRIAQVENASRRKSFRTFDLVRVVADVGELYSPVVAEKGLDFECRVPQLEMRIFGDSNLWMQALSNLLDNALKYTPEGGRIALRLEASEDGAWLLELRDSGPGIPESEMGRVFERFYRLPHHRRERGNGLGLTLVAAICDLHEARIELRNESGLVVLIELPTLYS